MNTEASIVVACSSLMLLTFVVGIRMLVRRVDEMKKNSVSPQSVALSAQRAERLKDSRASDNYNHLFELPVIFYALCGIALATKHMPGWLPVCLWIFVLLRIIHSVVQTTSNKVMLRFPIFLAGFVLLFATCIAYLYSYLAA